ncbi:MAG: ubiquitin-conjugating enzyme E2 [Promethearchaeota archaeon]|jgi:ubiquitin-protein ligase
MPELPIEIWTDRLTNEFTNLKKLDIIKQDSVKWYENNVEVTIRIKALGFVLESEGDPINLKPERSHQIFLKINRSFPYPGGIDFAWQSNIFHPNIHPVILRDAEKPGTGYICLNILKQWSRLSDLVTTTKALQKLVENPNPEDPLKYDICLKAAQFFKTNSIEKLKKSYGIEEENDDDDDIIILDD